MLTPELQHKIDEKWNICWPLCELKPIVILDLVSYLFFVKKISNRQPALVADQTTDPANAQVATKTEKTSGVILTGADGKKTEVSGDFFNDADNKNVCILLADPKGIAGLEKEYSTDPDYGSFIKGGLLMHPTSKLLDTSLGILGILNDADHELKGEIFAYLLSKAQYIDGNGHAYLPSYLVDLLVGIARPDKKDVVLNPTLGNGNILVNCARYAANQDSDSIMTEVASQNLKGMASDTTSLRISAMNLTLNGIYAGGMKALNIFAPLNSFSDIDATVILSNLIFVNGEKNDTADGSGLGETTRKDVFYLDFILRNLNEGARCAVVVPPLMSYHTGNESINIRKEITDNFKWNGLISIDDKNSIEFNGASILVFSKMASTVTDKIWFFKLKYDSAATDPGHLSAQTDAIINHFLKNGNSKDPGPGFFVDADTIRARNYNFSFNEYSTPQKEPVVRKSIATIKPDGFSNLENKDAKRSISLLQPPGRVSSAFETEPGLQAVSKKKRFVNWNAVSATALNLKKRMHVPRVRIAVNKKFAFVTGGVILLVAFGYMIYLILFSGNDGRYENKKPVAAVAESRVDKQVTSTSMHSIDSVVRSINSYMSKDSVKKVAGTYTVISKTFFYNAPNIGSPTGKYLTSTGAGILTSLKEENGFIYVNYINAKGRSTKGWLNKDDLEASGAGQAAFIPIETKTNITPEKRVKTGLNRTANNDIRKYQIRTKSYFYSEPDISTRLDLYLNKPNHTKLSAIEEKNGFVFVIYKNSQGKVTRGWLNKQDLEEVKN